MLKQEKILGQIKMKSVVFKKQKEFQKNKPLPLHKN